MSDFYIYTQAFALPMRMRYVKDMSDSEKLFWIKAKKSVWVENNERIFWTMRDFVDFHDPAFVNRYRIFL